MNRIKIIGCYRGHKIQMRDWIWASWNPRIYNFWDQNRCLIQLHGSYFMLCNSSHLQRRNVGNPKLPLRNNDLSMTDFSFIYLYSFIWYIILWCGLVKTCSLLKSSVSLECIFRYDKERFGESRHFHESNYIHWNSRNICLCIRPLQSLIHSQWSLDKDLLL